MEKFEGMDLDILKSVKKILKKVDEKADENPCVTDFQWAIRQLVNRGKAMTRRGWNGKDMFVEVQRPDKDSKMTHPYLFMVIPGCDEGWRRLPWQPSQVDIFATDWEIK